MLLNQPKSIQSTASIDVESQEKQAAKDQEQQSFWDRWFGDSAEEKDEKERKAFMEDPNLSPQEYLKIQQTLITSRKNMKSQNARIKTLHDEAQGQLLRTYEKFHKFVLSRDEEPWKPKEKHEALGGEELLSKIRFSNQEDTQGKEAHADVNKRKAKHLLDLKKEIENSACNLATYKDQLAAQMKNNMVFLNDQGRVLAVVEKATARQENNSTGQDLKRSHMYKTIVKAIYDSPALDALDPEEAEKERNDILEILRQLELVENKTDELIQRVLLKLKAIQQEESSQLATIEEQLNSQEQMNSVCATPGILMLSALAVAGPR